MRLREMPPVPRFNRDYRTPSPSIQSSSPFYKAFVQAFGPQGHGQGRTAAERYGLVANATSAADKLFFAAQVDKKTEKYARAIPVNYEKVKSPKTSPLMEKRVINSITHKYKYYDYEVPKRIYTDKSLMYA